MEPERVLPIKIIFCIVRMEAHFNANLKCSFSYFNKKICLTLFYNSPAKANVPLFVQQARVNFCQFSSMIARIDEEIHTSPVVPIVEPERA